MSTPTGFMEYRRAAAADREPLERISDWQEFHLLLDEEQLRTQGARCMDCGTPYCHAGIEQAGSLVGCPLHNLIPEWNHLVYRGLWREALERLHKTNNFPEFTGRVCPAPCEGSCTVGLIGEPVSIKSIEQAIADRGFAEGWITPEPPARRTGKRVAVVGSGPAGLAAAAQLNRAGHSVTVFERADRIGGLLTYGIPTMKLDKAIVERRVNLLKAEGIRFIVNTEVGRDIPARQLIDEFDAVLLCTGATEPRDIAIEGRGLRGIHMAMDFLNGTIRSYLDSGLADGRFIDAKDKDVIVIGGGDTGSDCVATALRHGCRSVTQFGTRARAPLERDPAANPWPQFPSVYTLDYAHEEARALFGSDPRVFSVLTKKFVGDERGNVKELHTIGIERIIDEAGNKIYREIPGTERIWKADLVVIAVGFAGPEPGLLQEFGLKMNRRFGGMDGGGKYRTNIDKVFVAGDMRRGQSLVVWAIREGREAAREADRWLMGTTQLP